MDKKEYEETEENYLAFPKTRSLSDLDVNSMEYDNSQRETMADPERVSRKQIPQIVQSDKKDDTIPLPKTRSSIGEPKNTPTLRNAGYPKSMDGPASTTHRNSAEITEILKKRMIENQKGIAAKQTRQNDGSECHDDSWLKLSSMRDPSLLKPSRNKLTPYPKTKEPLRISDYEESSGVDESKKYSQSKENKIKIPKMFARLKSPKSREKVTRKSNKLSSEYQELKDDSDGNEEMKELKRNGNDGNKEHKGDRRHTLYGEHVHDPWLPKVKSPRAHKKPSCPVKKLLSRKKSDTSKKIG